MKLFAQLWRMFLSAIPAPQQMPGDEKEITFYMGGKDGCPLLQAGTGVGLTGPADVILASSWRKSAGGGRLSCLKGGSRDGRIFSVSITRF